MIAPPFLLFLGDAPDEISIKTARGLAFWRPAWCRGQWRLPGCRVGLDLPEIDPAEAVSRGARAMVIGVANAGGVLPERWSPAIVAALRAGLDVASGFHTRLRDLPDVAAEAARTGRLLHDVRHPTFPLRVGTGEPRTGRRLLTVGTDCSVGKMYTALALERALRARGARADFRATGQTGVLIAGDGVCVDAVAGDFMAGAIEALTPDADPAHWDVVEGQGSLFHPSFAGVSLALLHGAAPHALVLCHQPGRAHMRGRPGRPLPGLSECAAANLAAARLTNPDVTLAGVCLDTSRLPDAERYDVLVRARAELGVPCVDPVKDGVEEVVDGLIRVATPAPPRAAAG